MRLGTLCAFALLLLTSLADARDEKGVQVLRPERLPGKGVWVDPNFEALFAKAGRLRAAVWFEEQLLRDGTSYRRRAKALSKWSRSELRNAAIWTLRDIHERARKQAEAALEPLIEDGSVRAVDWFWIVNGFSCGVTKEGLEKLKTVPGVRKIFHARIGGFPRNAEARPTAFPPDTSQPPFDPKRFKHPWYARALLADKVWNELGVSGRGTLNVIHDHNFVFSPHVVQRLHHNPRETPGNGKDDDGNGFVDDVHGYNFDHDTAALTRVSVDPQQFIGNLMHGFMCAAVVCGAGTEQSPYELGIAPEARWAGVITGRRMEWAVQWAIEQGAHTYSMSFSAPDRGEYRSHWRKLMEHGALCGVCFVSGAGNNGTTHEVPVQMRQPEDIPDVVFSAAGVQRNLARTPTSSRGPVVWKTEHYDDGEVPKPEVCAFNFDLPRLYLDGRVAEGGLGGNSFAGPMFCGTISLMMSADPELKAFDVREIITQTATDIAKKGFDDETGHGLINCYRAVKEVLRRKAKREGRDAKPYTGREKGDALDVKAYVKRMKPDALRIRMVAPKGQAKQLDVQVDDVVVSYDGEAIDSQTALRAAIRAARKKKGKIPFVLRRAGKEHTVQLDPGRVGIGTGHRYPEPVFE